MKKNIWKQGEKTEIIKTIFSIGDEWQEIFDKILDFHVWKSGEVIKDINALSEKMLLVARLALAKNFLCSWDKNLKCNYNHDFFEKYKEIVNLIYACENGDSPLFAWESEPLTKSKKVKKSILVDIPM